MNKQELIDVVKSKVTEEYTHKQLEELLDLFTDTLLETVATGADVNLAGFGKFTKKTRKGKTIVGKIPWMVGKTFTVPETNYVKFHPAEAVKRLFNSTPPVVS